MPKPSVLTRVFRLCGAENYPALYLGLALGGAACPAGGQEFGLPVVGNNEPTGQSVPDLTSPALHAAGVELGAVSGLYSADGKDLTINQTSAEAIIDWSQFNIAAGNRVDFQQPSAQSITLNDIHQADASQILGDVKANGQVYLINANGFLFGPRSDVNVNTLVASSLGVSDSVFQQGIVNVVSDGAPAVSVAGNAAATPVAALTADGSIYRQTPTGPEKIRVWVEKGAQITAQDSGRVLLAAPEVENDGVIQAPDGQVILAAASDKVYLQESSSSDLRGLLVEVQTGGGVKNLGSILTQHGNTTMMGFAVAQQGLISASTSVALNGSVRLLAREGAQLVNVSNSTVTNYILEPAADGTVRRQDLGDGLGEQASVALASGSQTLSPLDGSAGDAAASQAQPQSVIDIEGGLVQMQSGAVITAHGGQVNLEANLSPVYSNQDFPDLPPALPTSAANPSRIIMQPGSRIDVSGVKDVPMSMSSNQVSLTLFSNELRNDPWQKNGVLYGQKVYLDARAGTDLADISGALAERQYSVLYRNANAGTVNFASDGDTWLAPGSRVDISGGWLDYQAGALLTTELVSANQSMVSMSDASPQRVYTQLFDITAYQAAYRQGMNAGVVNIVSRDSLLYGDILAQTVNGEYQRTAATEAQGGQLTVDSAWSGVYQQDVVFGNQAAVTPLAAATAQTPLTLSNALFKNGVQTLSIKTGGNASILPGTQLNLPDFAKFSLQAGAINDAGAIVAPSGSVSLVTQVGVDRTRASSGAIQVSPGAVIDVSGLWVNDWLALQQQQALGLTAYAGGSLSLSAQGDLSVAAGAQLRADGGAWMQAGGKILAGDGGSLSLSSAGNDAETTLNLQGELSAIALSQNGQLSVTANSVTIVDGVQAASQGQLFLSSALFGAGAFGAYKLTANDGGLLWAADAAPLRQQNWLLGGVASQVAGGAELRQIAAPVLLPLYQRTAVDLSLNVLQTVQGVDENASLSIAGGASLVFDPNAKVGLLSDANITVDGAVDAPAGSISLTVEPPPNANSDPGYNPLQAITLGGQARLAAPGAVINTPYAPNVALGQVLDAGTVTLNAERGYILMAGGASIDVSGTAAPVQLINSLGVTRQWVAGNAGAVSLEAAEGMSLYGGFSAAAGSGATAGGGQSTAAGGSLTLELNAQNRNEPFDVPFPTGERVIQVSQLPAAESEGLTPGVNGVAAISARQIAQAGFAGVKLETYINTQTQSQAEPQLGAIDFMGSVNLSAALRIELDAPAVNFIPAGSGGGVNLTTDVLTVGSSQNQSILPGAVLGAGGGLLQAKARQIEFRGALALNGFGSSQFTSSGAIEFVGVNPNLEGDLLGALSAGGALSLDAQALYPSTMTQFSIDAASVSIGAAGGAPQTPLSAAGALNISAAAITDAGRILAPFGRISMTAADSLILAAGSLTSVADAGLAAIPFGYTQGNGEYWIYPLGEAVNIQTGAPEKSITLNSPNLDLQSGSKVDLSGGGDLQAYELTPAPGGNIDFLSQTYQTSYAVLPERQDGFAAYDPLQSAGAGLGAGEDIYLTAAAGLPAGDYQLLPSYDALLPGAYLITPLAGSAGMAANTTQTTVDGGVAAAGYIYQSGSSVSASLWSGYEVQTGASVAGYAPYLLSSAGSFFAAKNDGASLPQDAGDLSLNATQNLQLAGDIAAKAASGGLGGMLDISAANIRLASQAAPAANGVITLSTQSLNKLGVDSILIGGKRTRGGGATQLTVTADTVTVAGDAQLQGPEIVLAAAQTLDVESGAQLTAQGAAGRSDTLLQVSDANGDGAGALLRLSDSGQATIERASVQEAQGDLNIAAGATLSSAGSMLIDATGNSSLLGNLHMPQGDLSLSAGLITLGGAGSAQGGLQLPASVLDNLHVSSLTLRSAGGINIDAGADVQAAALTLDAAEINSGLSAGQSAQIDVTQLTLQNSGAAGTSVAGSGGQGDLRLQAATVTLGAGGYALQGFNQVSIDAKQEMLESGVGNLAIGADVSVSAPVWTGLAGANTRIDLGRHQFTLSGGGGEAGSGYGAQLQVNAGVIADSGLMAFTGGAVTLSAANGVNLAAGAQIDVAGQAAAINGADAGFIDGGRISLLSAAGDVNVADGAVLNLAAAAGGGSGGDLSLSAAQGAVNVAGVLLGSGGQGGAGGEFSLTAADSPGLIPAALLTQLAHGGFSGAVSLHYTSGNIELAAGQAMDAATIALSADNGTITIDGALDASGAQSGSIALAANGGIGIGAGANLSANAGAANAAGGVITLTSAPVSGGGGVGIAAGAALSVAGGAGGAGGKVMLLVNRLGANDAAVTAAASPAGAAQAVVYAFAHTQDAAPDNTLFSGLLADSQTFLNNAAANADLQQRLGGFSLAPGLDIVNDQTSALDWNVTAALTGAVATPGLLSLRSAGDLNIEQSLGDGFNLVGNSWQLSSGDSWSFDLVAGAAAGAANLTATEAGAGNLTIASNTWVRTGTGDISLTTGGDITLTDWTSVVYTAGKASGLTDSYANYRPVTFAVQYPDQGGSVSLQAGGDIIGASTPQVVSDWLQRSGDWNPNAAIGKLNLPTAWGIDFGQATPRAAGTGTTSVNAGLGFRENVGALGGGNITVNAGGNVVDLSVVAPTNALSRVADGVATLIEQGGGNIVVHAGGDIEGGLIYVEKGQASISAGGSITGGSQYTGGPALAIGDAQFSLTAGDGLALSSVFNPFVVAQAGVQSSKMDYFLTYTAQSSLKLQSLAGNIVLNNNTSLISRQITPCSDASCAGSGSGSFYNNLNYETDVTPLLALYPANLWLGAWQGDIEVNNVMTLAPAANSSFDLYAAADISFASDAAFGQLDVAPGSLLPAAQATTRFSLDTDYWLPSNYDNALAHAATPVHAADTEPNQVAAGGNIVGLQDGAVLSAAKATEISAAQNINNLSLYLQNLPSASQDVSTLSAGGNISFPNVRNLTTGEFIGSGFVQISGPGNLDVWAGGSLDLGDSAGIVSYGGLSNPALAGVSGASISVLAGVSAAATAASLNHYLQTYASAAYVQQVQAQMAGVKASGSDLALLTSAYSQILASARAAEKNWTENGGESAALHWALPILFAQFRWAATLEQITRDAADYKIGYQAIAALFPKPAAGDIVLDFSQIQTLAGGDINLLAPGGLLNVGLAASDISLNKSAADLGVVAQAAGSVNILTHGDVLVNESRIFTLDGGDITIWSNDGNIDAGRGANSSLATPLPAGYYDALGNLILAYPAVVSGSGIRAQSGYHSPVIGSFAFAAPHGVINASEGGISGLNGVLAAQAVVNASNIQVPGLSLGLPQSQSALGLPDASGAAAAAISRLADVLLAVADSGNDRPVKAAAPIKFLSLHVDLLGFGRCGMAEIRAGKEGC